MKCPACKAEDTIVAKLIVAQILPLRKGGGVQPSPVTVAQMKELWEKGTEGGKVIECNSCSQEYRYFTGKGLVKIEDVENEDDSSDSTDA